MKCCECEYFDGNPNIHGYCLYLGAATRPDYEACDGFYNKLMEPPESEVLQNE